MTILSERVELDPRTRLDPAVEQRWQRLQDAYQVHFNQLMVHLGVLREQDLDHEGRWVH